MQFLTPFLVCVLLLGAGNARGGVFSKSCDELNLLWSEKLHRHVKAAWPLEPFECPSDYSKIVEAIVDLRDVSKRVVALEGPDFFGFFTQNVSTLKYAHRSENRGIGHHAIAQCDTLNAEITLFDAFHDSVRSPRVWRSAVLVHEATHAMGSVHVTCTKGKYRGLPMCDETFVLDSGFRTNSFSNSIWYLWWLRETTDLGRLHADYINASIGFILDEMINAADPKTYAKILPARKATSAEPVAPAFIEDAPADFTPPTH